MPGAARSPRLVEVCESLCERLRSSVGLTSVRVELRREPSPIAITLRSDHAIPYHHRHAWMLAPPARLEFTISGETGIIARVELEDVTRDAYPASATDECARIAADYARALTSIAAASEL